MKLVLPLPTSLNKLYINQSVFDKNTKTYVPTGKRILSKDGRLKKSMIRGQARVQLEQQDWDFERTEIDFVYQDITVYFARRGSDTDNILKLLNDSLQGIVYVNDCMVMTRFNKILYSPKNPHIELEYSFSPQVGVFDNQEQMNQFLLNCESCKHFRKSSCSVLKELVNGTVNENYDVKNVTCEKFEKKKTK